MTVRRSPRGDLGLRSASLARTVCTHSMHVAGMLGVHGHTLPRIRIEHAEEGPLHTVCTL